MNAINFIRSRFATAVIKSEPFPYLVIRNVLPPLVYNWAVAHMPPAWRWRLAAIHDSYPAHRRQHVAPLAIATLARSIVRGDLAQPMISMRQGCRGSPSLRSYSDEWTTHLEIYVDLIGGLLQQVFKLERPAQTEFANMCRRIEWQIAPHVHTKDQAIQAMIYFAPDEYHPKLGTILYRPKGNKPLPTQSTSTVVADEAALEPAVTLPYLPNTLVAWLNNDVSFHSSPIGRNAPRDYIFMGCSWQR